MNIDHLRNNLPSKPFKKTRVLKAFKTNIHYKNLWAWIVTNGDLSKKADEAQSIDNVLRDENGIEHVLLRSDDDSFDLSTEQPVISVWKEVGREIVWQGIYVNTNTGFLSSPQIANHYNMHGGGISLCINNLKHLTNKEQN